MRRQNDDRRSEDRRSTVACGSLDRAADGAQDLADLAAQEDEGDDRDDGDEGEDQRVLRETLAVLVLRSGDERWIRCILDVSLYDAVVSRTATPYRSSERCMT